MVEPFSAALGASALKNSEAIASEGAKSVGALLNRLFGPSADVIGNHWAGALEAKYSNVRKVAEMAAARTKVGSGDVPPRLGASVFDAAQYADDEMVAEYLSGVLSSSLDGDTGDRGIPWSALIARMSADSLKLHHIVFSILRQITMTHTIEYNQLLDDAIYIPMTVLFEETGWSAETFGARMTDAIDIFVREALIYDQYSFGDGEMLNKVYPKSRFPDPNGALIIAATGAGLSLYLWGLGAGGVPASKFADPEFELRTTDGLPTGPYQAVGYLQEFTKAGTLVNDRYRPRK